MATTCRPVGRARLLELMIAEARFRDRLSFGSDGNHAAQLGVSRRTIIRWRKQLEDEGRIIRCGWHRWGVGKRTVVYKFPGNVTQRLRRHKPSPSGLRSYRYVRTYALGCATKRGHMGEIERAGQPPVIPEPTARDVVATVCDTFSAKGIPLSSRHKGIIARQAKELLTDGFDYETVVISAVIALRRAQPQNLHFIAADLVMARAGERMTRREYEKALQDEMELR